MFSPAHLRLPRRDRTILGGSLVALAVAAWLTVWLWEGSPYGAYLHHAGSAGPVALEAALFSLGWVLMIVAMMLPSSIPLVVTFGALVRRRRRPGQLVLLLLVGYLLVWGAFGLGAWLADRGSPRRGRCAALARRASAGHHRHHARRRRPVAVQPAP